MGRWDFFSSGGMMAWFLYSRVGGHWDTSLLSVRVVSVIVILFFFLFVGGAFRAGRVGWTG